MPGPALTATSALDALEEGVIIHGPDTEILYANRAAAALLGLDPGTLRRRTSCDSETLTESGAPLPPEDRPVARVRRTGRPERRTILGVRRPAGDVVWLRVSCRPFRRPNGGHGAAYLSSLVDITALKEAESRAGAAANGLAGGGGHERALSPREREVLELLAAGMTGEQAAELLGISPATVRVHIRNGLGKLGATTRAHAVAIALVRGEIRAPAL